MDLRRLKTIFIFVLIAINIILMIVLNSAKSYEREEKKAMAENLSGVLAKSMIYLPQELEIPETPDIYNFYIEKMFGSSREMIAKFLGEDYERENDGEYISSTGRLFVDGDEFKYFNYNPSGSVTDFSQENIEKLCRNEMENLGIMPDVYQFNGLNFVEDGTRAIFTVKHDDAEFFDAYISFDLSGKGIFSVAGKNLISDFSVSGGTVPYFSVVSVLADITKSEKLEKNRAHTIVSIRPGYYIGKGAESYRNILAIPVWQVATDTGVILHYDARNGQEVKE